MRSNYIQTDLSFDSDSQDDKPFISSCNFMNLQTANIIDVWAHNFDEEFKKIMKLNETYKIIAMDTEFPGICVPTPIQPNNSNYQLRNKRTFSNLNYDYQYKLVKTNVQATKLIQVGITLSNQNGQVPLPYCCWQFNLRFDRDIQPINKESQTLLEKAGINFNFFKRYGIQYEIFAQYLFASGLILNKKNKWVVFHGSYDLGYFLKLLIGQNLPETLNNFINDLQKYFHIIIDLKEVIQQVSNIKDIGLTKLAQKLRCQRIGSQHQAGSDSLLTLQCYFAMNLYQDTNEALSLYFYKKKHLRCQIYNLYLSNTKERIKSLEKRENQDEQKMIKKTKKNHYVNKNQNCKKKIQGENTNTIDNSILRYQQYESANLNTYSQNNIEKLKEQSQLDNQHQSFYEKNYHNYSTNQIQFHQNSVGNHINMNINMNVQNNFNHLHNFNLHNHYPFDLNMNFYYQNYYYNQNYLHHSYMTPHHFNNFNNAFNQFSQNNYMNNHNQSQDKIMIKKVKQQKNKQQNQ